jgi:hypothetical protein
MYQYNIDITYNDDDSYQAAFLSLFNLTEYDGCIISQTMDELFATMKDNNDWMELLKELTGKHLLSYDVERDLGISILLSYDYLELFHREIQKFHRKETFSLLDLHATLEKK